MAEGQAEKKPGPGSHEEQVIMGLIKTCLLSTFGEITPRILDRDFCVMVGYRIPYAKLGYDSLDSFIKRIPNIVVRQVNGELRLRPVRVESAGRNTYQRQNSYQMDGNSRYPLERDVGQYANSWQYYEGGTMQGRPPFYYPGSNLRPGIVQEEYNPNYLGRNYDPNYKHWWKQSREGHYYQPQLPAMPVEGGRVMEFEYKKHTPQEPVVERKTALDKIMEKMTLAENNNENSANREDPLEPRMLVEKGNAGANGRLENERTQNIEVGITEHEITAYADVMVLQRYLYGHGLPLASFHVETDPATYCEIKVHMFYFHGYQKDNQNLQECLQEIARNALKVLKAMDMPREKDFTRPVNFLNRLLAIVYTQPTGIWRSYVAEAYLLKYEEVPPDNWAECFLIKTESLAVIRMTDEIRGIFSEIWKPKLVSFARTQPTVPVPLPIPKDQLPSHPPPQMPQSPREFVQINPTAPVETKPENHPQKLAIVKQVHLIPRKRYVVEVTSVMSDSSFWVRLSTSYFLAKYEKMMDDLASCGSLMGAVPNNPVVVPTVGTCYMVFINSTWFRARLTNLLQGGMAIVRLIDVGQEEKLPVQSCFYLPEQLTSLPGLAVRCVLDGFEVLECRQRYTKFLKEAITRRKFFAEVIGYHGGLPAIYLTGMGHLSDFVVNHVATNVLTDAISNCRALSVDQVYMAHLTHVNDEGGIFVQLRDDGEVLLKIMSQQVEHKLLSHKPKPVREIKPGTEVYFARLLDTQNSIIRVVALSPPESDKVYVSFIDSGEKGHVPLRCLYELQGYFDQLYRLGAQAMMVRLEGISAVVISKKMGQRLQELAPPNTSILLKVTTLGVVPVVEMFKRIMPDNVLMSMNNALLTDPSLKGPPAMVSLKPYTIATRLTEQAASLSVALEPFPAMMPFTPVSEHLTLPPPVVPSVGSEFDIHVPMVSNPANFIVQPWNTYFVLQTLMCDLQSTFEGSNPEDAPPASDIAPGNAYAAQHPDGRWYRVTTSSPLIDDDTVLANFADYGDLQVLRLTNLRRLAPHFCKLPCQAIRANLYGIKPLHQDWCVQDCLAFQALVNEKQFVSIVMSEAATVRDLSEGSVSLRLIDTSGPEDIHIDQILVTEGRAEFVANDV